MVLPTDTASFDQLHARCATRRPTRSRCSRPARPTNAGAAAGSPARLGGVLPITPTNAQGRTFALHPAMGALQTMFNTDKRLAILPNVGPLIAADHARRSTASRRTASRPACSRTTTSRTPGRPSGPKARRVGWGGRMGDLLASMNQRTVFTSITAGGNAVWLSGQDVRQYQVSSNGAIRLGTNASGQVYGSTAVGAAMERIVQTTRGGHVLEADLSAVAARSMQAESLLRNALKPASDPLFGTAPATGDYNANNDPKLRYTDPNNRHDDRQQPRAAAADRGAHDRRQRQRVDRRASARCSSSAWAASTRTTCRTATTRN